MGLYSINAQKVNLSLIHKIIMVLMIINIPETLYYCPFNVSRSKIVT